MKLYISLPWSSHEALESKWSLELLAQWIALATWRPHCSACSGASQVDLMAITGAKGNRQDKDEYITQRTEQLTGSSRSDRVSSEAKLIVTSETRDRRFIVPSDLGPENASSQQRSEFSSL